MSADLTATMLRDRIAELTKRATPELRAKLEAEITRLAATDILRGVAQVGARAPDFKLADAHGGAVSLSGLRPRGPVVVTFYRGGWCPYCDIQLRMYQRVLGEVRALKGELVAISPQQPDFAADDVTAKELLFPVLSDVGNHVARAYGLVYQVGEPARIANVPERNGDASWELPIPATFVIDRAGLIRFAHVETDFRVRLEPAALLAALRDAR